MQSVAPFCIATLASRAALLADLAHFFETAPANTNVVPVHNCAIPNHIQTHRADANRVSNHTHIDTLQQ